MRSVVRPLGIVILAFVFLLSFVPRTQAATGTFTQYNYNSTYTFKVYVPSTYTAGTSVPLMVMLHGCSQNADDFAAGTQMNALADQKNFIVLYPQQPSSQNVSNCWNWFLDADQHRGSGEPATIKGMVDWVKSNYSIDASHVYVAGLSAGAAMSVIMGVTYPDVFHGVGVSAGLEYDAADTSSAGIKAMKSGGPDPNTEGTDAYNEMGIYKAVMPVIVFQGTSDTTVYPVNANQVITQWAQSNDWSDDGVDNNSINDTAAQTINGQVPNGRSYTETIYNNSSGSSLMELYKVNGMVHAWSGGSSTGSYTDPTGPNATQIMYDFFMSH